MMPQQVGLSRFRVTVGATEAYCLESAGAYRVVGWRMASVEPAAALHVEPAAAGWRGKGERMAPAGRKGVLKRTGIGSNIIYKTTLAASHTATGSVGQRGCDLSGAQPKWLEQ